MKNATHEDIMNFIEKDVIGLLEKHFPQVASGMAVFVNDYATGTSDLPHQCDAIIYLEDRLWATEGGKVQLLLETSLSIWPETEGIDGTRHCVGVWVHPLSWLRELLSFLQTRAEAGSDLPWEHIPMERFYNIQNATVIRDPGGVFAHLKNVTCAELYPGWLWDRHLISGLQELLENLRSCRRALASGREIEAGIMAADVIPQVLRLGFIIHRQYYPDHPHLRWAFEQLPDPAGKVLEQVDAAVTSGDVVGRLNALRRVEDIYLEYVSENNLLPTVELKSPDMGLGDLDAWEQLHQELLWAARCKAWSNPRWRDWITNCQNQAAEEGHPQQWWIWSLWDMKKAMPHI